MATATRNPRMMTILIDTREQVPLESPDFATQRATLAAGDYSCVCDGVDLRTVVSIERKSLGDLLACVSNQRDRFERELARLAQVRFRALVIEASMASVAAGTCYSQLTPRQVLGSVLAWTWKHSVPPIFASDRQFAAMAVATLLRHAARYSQATNLRPTADAEE